MEVSEAQKKAIEHNKGPMMVLAGPGSGKTFVITNRTRYLIEQCGVSPYNILVITFTKASAEEMKERFIRLWGEAGRGVNFGTFHAIFFTILKYQYNFNSSNILKQDTKKQFLKSVIDKYNIDTEDEKELIETLESEISAVKSEMMDINNYYATSCSDETFRHIYNDYKKMLNDSRLVDFDDMIVLCYKLLIQKTDVLKAWQNKFQYILIDEFQDINKLQYEIVRLLAKEHQNLFIVGDDDQSIYRFRGAKPEIMLNFDKDYPNAKRILLDINFRSTKCIVESAGRVVKNNKERFKKDIVTINEQGRPIVIKEFKTDKDENLKVIHELIDYNKDGKKWSDIAILYRTNTQPRLLIQKLMEYNIPFSIKDSIPSIYEHWIAKDILNYIKTAKNYLENNKKDISRSMLLRIINKPNRYIARNNIMAATNKVKKVDELLGESVDMLKLKNLYLDKQWMIKRIEQFEYDLEIIGKSKPYDAIEYIRKEVGYNAYINEYSVEKKINLEDLMEVLDEVTESSKDYKTFEEWLASIEQYEQKLKEKFKDKKDKDAVWMTTFHGSKGLEFDTVFIIDANEGITPHKKSLLEEDMEEERRMFYVAMTRAKKNLHVYYSVKRLNKDVAVSRFVGEIFIDKDDLVEGAEVEHVRYGKGKVIKVDDNKITVKFEKEALSKVLDIDYCIGNRILKI